MPFFGEEERFTASSGYLNRAQGLLGGVQGLWSAGARMALAGAVKMDCRGLRGLRGLQGAQGARREDCRSGHH